MHVALAVEQIAERFAPTLLAARVGEDGDALPGQARGECATEAVGRAGDEDRGDAQMLAQSAQTESGITPVAISAPKIRQPTQNAKTDSSVAKTTSSAVSASATVVQPSARPQTAAIVVTPAPMPWAKRFGGPAT
jgi:hypothetical protein